MKNAALTLTNTHAACMDWLVLVDVDTPSELIQPAILGVCGHVTTAPAFSFKGKCSNNNERENMDAGRQADWCLSSNRLTDGTSRYIQVAWCLLADNGTG